MYQLQARIPRVNPGRAGRKSGGEWPYVGLEIRYKIRYHTPEIPPRPRDTPSARSDLPL